MVDEKNKLLKSLTITGPILRDDRLTMPEKLVWSYLDFRKGGNDYCWQSVETIAMDLASNNKTIKNIIRRLEKKKFLLVDYSKGGKKRTNHYTAVIPERGKNDPVKQGKNFPVTDEPNGEKMSSKRGKNVQQTGKKCPANGEKMVPQNIKGKEKIKEKIKIKGGGKEKIPPSLKHKLISFPESAKIYEAWRVGSNVNSHNENGFDQIHQAIRTYGKEITLHYVSKTKATRAGFIISQIDADSAEGKLPYIPQRTP